MTYFYPYGIPQPAVSASFATATISASFATSAATRALTASHAQIAQNTGPSGSAGGSPSCGAGPQGPSGSVGLSGPQGSALLGCPPNTRQCTGINVGGYAFVCIQVLPDCTLERTRCPGEVPTTTTTAAPTTTTTTTTTSPPGCSGTCGQSTYCTPPCVCSVDPEGIVMGVCQDPGDE
jgi:hypothetical protein